MSVCLSVPMRWHPVYLPSWLPRLALPCCLAGPPPPHIHVYIHTYIHTYVHTCIRRARRCEGARGRERKRERAYYTGTRSSARSTYTHTHALDTAHITCFPPPPSPPSSRGQPSTYIHTADRQEARGGGGGGGGATIWLPGMGRARASERASEQAGGHMLWPGRSYVRPSTHLLSIYLSIHPSIPDVGGLRCCTTTTTTDSLTY
ncbi:hypothetical protein F4780DRAFT_478762 [Xylariomycetidae sp. FL0641]|nr:hypothetical protein F4780DRAFT_478762 [Xylariomycetidae sp. FL0641]